MPPSFVPDPQTASKILGFLAGLRSSAGGAAGLDEGQLLAWLAESDLGGLAEGRFKEHFPEAAGELQEAAFTTAARNAIHWHHLAQIDEALAHCGVDVVLLKGAALAATVYGGPEQRSMADVDLWLQGRDMRQACAVMVDLGFENRQKTERPLALQALSDGEIQYYSDGRPPTLVELHLSPFPGWWLKRAAAIDNQAVWGRRERLGDWRGFYQLAAEDAVIQLAVHLAVNHQFGLAPLRGLMDIALTAQGRRVDWHEVAVRARQWRVATAVWLVLSCLQTLVGTPGLERALEPLRPRPWKRRMLRRLVTPASIVAHNDLTAGRSRYLFLLLLVDRPSDAMALLLRTIWPEQAWLDARYGGSANHWRHLAHLIREREV